MVVDSFSSFMLWSSKLRFAARSSGGEAGFWPGMDRRAALGGNGSLCGLLCDPCFGEEGGNEGGGGLGSQFVELDALCEPS